MSRLYLVIFLIFGSSFVFGQNKLPKYLDFAKKQYDKGDYYYALVYYDKALELDSNTVDIVWNYAETLRAYKDYRKAEFYYAKVYEKESGKLYPASLLNLGLMQKQNGKYDEAIETFKLAKKKYYKNKKGYLYKKSKRELESTIWATSAIIDSVDGNFDRLPETVNTVNSEFGHGIYNGELIFSSLRADSINSVEEVYSPEYSTSIYRSKKSEVSFESSERIKSLFMEKLSTGNGSFSLDGTRFYFSLCSEENFQYRCKIMVAQYGNGKWFAVDSLGSIINEPGSNTTMPCIANLGGDEALIFASDREDSKGGLDLFYSKIRNGNQYKKVRALKSANSLDNDVTPWWDEDQQRLYFSSSWHNGFGGYDVFYLQYTDRFGKPVNLGQPINGPANDLYYFRDLDTGYVTSNRIGVMFSKNPTCCSDIFSLKPPKIIVPPTPEETLADLNKRLPVTLYFHNDVPNPRSWDTTSNVNYMDSYDDYTAMLETYKKEYSKGLTGQKSNEAEEDIEDFFIQYVDKGVADLELFRNLLMDELEKGAKINITVKGFASPLAKTDYNVNLTKRRIASLVNYMSEYEDGIFVPYLNGTAENGGKVVFSQVPFGEYTANQLTSDNPNDVQNSVYSRAAAIERKIEIQSVSYLEDDSEFAIVSSKPVIDAGTVKHGELITGTFEVKNDSDKEITFKDIRIPCECITSELPKTTLAPGESMKVKMDIDSNVLMDFFVKSIYLGVEGSDEELRLYISGTVVPE
ncbi:MAG: DUF1573 domain-containing protein [Crocinitomicaceae bacterium]|nr:DUF1573 domain-containing protein [Crocinitomicaceae bacterium]